MDLLKLVNTDKVCNSSLKKYIYLTKNTSSPRNRIDMVLKEAIQLKFSFKKVGMPTLVKIKKECANKISFKKAGLHPIGNKMTILKLIFQITMLMVLLKTSCTDAVTLVPRCPPRSPSPPPPRTPCRPPQAVCPATQLISWAHWSGSTNKLIRMINGNGRKGYNIGLWNCRRGLINGEKCSSFKMVEVQQILENINLHMLCLVESDLHSPISRFIRRHPLSNDNKIGIRNICILL